jgi:hypothetical protein
MIPRGNRKKKCGSNRSCCVRRKGKIKKITKKTQISN